MGIEAVSRRAKNSEPGRMARVSVETPSKLVSASPLSLAPGTCFASSPKFIGRFHPGRKKWLSRGGYFHDVAIIARRRGGYWRARETRGFKPMQYSADRLAGTTTSEGVSCSVSWLRSASVHGSFTGPWSAGGIRHGGDHRDRGLLFHLYVRRLECTPDLRGTVHPYERHADGTVEAVAIVAGAVAAIALGLVVVQAEET